MKKTLLIALVVSFVLLTFTIPAQAWSWKDDAQFEVAEYWVYVAEEGEIIVDGELDEGYLQGTRIESYEDEIPYKRGRYDAVWDDADGTLLSAWWEGLLLYRPLRLQWAYFSASGMWRL